MSRQRVGCLLVADENGNLLGVVTWRDLLWVFFRPDDEIRAEITDEVLRSYLETNPVMVRVDAVVGVDRMIGSQSPLASRRLCSRWR